MYESCLGIVGYKKIRDKIMKRIFAAITLALAIATSINAEDRSLEFSFGDIKSITAGNAYAYTFEIHVTKGRSHNVEIVYDTEIEKDIKDFDKYLKLEYSHGKASLTLGMDEPPKKFGRLKFTGRRSPIRVYLEMDDLEKIDLSGASVIYFDGNFTSESFEADMSGATKFGNMLHLNGKSLSLDCSGAAKAMLSGNFKTIDIDLSGATNFSFTGSADEFKGDLSGASKLNCNGEYKNCELECSGGVSVEMQGSGDSISLECSGACKVDAKDFSTKKAYVELSGACNTKIQTSDELKYDVSTTSKLVYYGSPKIIDLSEDRNVIQGVM